MSHEIWIAQLAVDLSLRYLLFNQIRDLPNAGYEVTGGLFEWSFMCRVFEKQAARGCISHRSQCGRLASGQNRLIG